MGSSFERAIAEHLELKQRNTGLERSLPLARYLDAPRDDPSPPAEPDSWWEAAETTWESLAFSWDGS